MSDATKLAREALEEAIEFAEQDHDALTPAGERMVERWRKALAALSAAPEENEGTLTDPTAADLKDPIFNAIWNVIKRWDISRDGRSGSYHEPTGTDVMTILQAIRSTRAAAPAGKAGTFADGIAAAAKFIASRRDAYHNERGSYDPSTGQWEYPGDGDEYVGELEEIEEGIRALAQEPRNG